MGRGRFGEFVSIAVCLGTGLVCFYLGYFYTGTICDSSQPTCTVKAAFTPQPMVLLVGAVFFLFGLLLLVRALREPKVNGPMEGAAAGVTSAEETRVAREAQADFTAESAIDPSNTTRPRGFGSFVIPTVLLVSGLVSLYFGYVITHGTCDVRSRGACYSYGAGADGIALYFLATMLLLVGLSLLLRAVQNRKAKGLMYEARHGVSAVDQAWLGREARAVYTKAGRGYNAAAPKEFDRRLLSLFDSIEAGSDDIDTKIEGLRYFVRHEGFFKGWGDKTRVQMLWQSLSYTLMRRDGKLKTPEMWQLRCNWNRMLRIAGSTWGTEYTIAPMWLNPAPVARLN